MTGMKASASNQRLASIAAATTARKARLTRP